MYMAIYTDPWPTYEKISIWKIVSQTDTSIWFHKVLSLLWLYFFIVYIYMHNWNLWKCDIPASINYTHIEIYKRLMRYYITTVLKATWGLFQFIDHLPRYRDSIIKTSEWVIKFNSLSRTADSRHQHPCIIKMREWYFYNGNSSTGKRASLYWNSLQLYEPWGIFGGLR